MPAKSKAQQGLMGAVYAAKKGGKPASPEVAKIAKGMTKKAAKDFASTSTKSLPKKVKEATDTVVKDEKGNVKSWKHEGDWKKSTGKELRGKVTHASDVARRKSEKMSKAEKDMAESFEKALEGKADLTIKQGANKGKQWSPKTPGVTNKDFDPRFSPPDGATAPPPGYKAPKGQRAEVTPTASDSGDEVVTASMKRKGKKVQETLDKIRALKKMIAEAKKGSKPDFLDMDKDGDKKEPMKKAVSDKKKKPFVKVKEGAKPDFLDMDKDGNKKEPMKKAVKDKKVSEAVKEKEPEGTYSKKRFETDGQRVARLAKEKMQAKKKAEKKKVDEGKDVYMESLHLRLQNQLNG